MKKSLRLFFLIIIVGFGIAINAQNRIQQQVALNWDHHPYVEKGLEYLHFSEATYNEDFGHFPIYTQLFSCDTPGKKAEILLQNPIFIPIAMEHLIRNEDMALLSDTLSYQLISKSELRKSNAFLSLLPFRINPETHLIERLYCVDIVVVFSDDAKMKSQQATADNFPSKSPLADGEWYEIQVTKSGVYKITGASLSEMGMNIGAINPKNLKLYGVQGGMLPEMVTEIPNTGIREIAISVSTKNSNTFGTDDYILFYGESPHSWKYNSETSRYSHSYNIYADYTSYYLSASSDQEGKRIESVNNNDMQETYTSSQGDYCISHEQDLTNIINAGRIWLGERFTANQSQVFSVTVPDIVTSEPVFFSAAAGVDRKTSGESKKAVFTFSVDNAAILTLTYSNTENIPLYRNGNTSFNTTTGTIPIKVSFQFGESASEGWLDYFEVQARKNLKYHNEQMGFRDKKSIKSDNITKFTVQNGSGSTLIWDVTDFSNVKKMITSVQSGSVSFKTKTDQLREFVVFNTSDCYQPIYKGKIGNQNLMGLRNIQSVIIAYPDFISEAKKIADEHENNLGLTTVVLTPQQIYTEYAAGKADICAIRDFMRMLDITATQKPPQFLLLFGDASYDYKNKLSQSNFVPTWASANAPSKETFNFKNEDVSDDFYALVNTGDGGNGSYLFGLPGFAVGRFPVKSLEEAQNTVKKRLHYTSKATETLGSWKNVFTFVADDPDSGNSKDYFAQSCEGHEATILSVYPKAIIEKIYADSYTRVVEASGARYPDVNKAVTTQINQGTMFLNYVGHGSYESLSAERLIEISDVKSWTNFDHLTFVITEACSYAPFDNPAWESAGEIMFLQPSGGAIAMLTSARETSNSTNNVLSRVFYDEILPSESNQYKGSPVGTATMMAKRRTAAGGNMNSNNLKYVLFGDPALTLAFPEYDIACTSINGNDVTTKTDTISALTSVTFEGEIRNTDGSLKSDFNGRIFPVVFDKQQTVYTLGQVNEATIMEYGIWKNIIFKGNEAVKNGKFSFEFFVPKDIDYSFDYSKVSFYAYDENNKNEGGGVFNKFVVGGINPNPNEDNTPPKMSLYMNDTYFKSGGYTNQNPSLLVMLYDESGINATGSAIGHDIVAILDNDVNNPIILNNYYESIEGYKKGRVLYPFYNLSEGEHCITVRAWDAYNNSTVDTITFVVVGSPKFVMDELRNYPNPFSNTTYFVFNHNGANETLDISIRIYDMMGRLVREIKQSSIASGYRIPPIQWNGDLAGGGLVSNGYYIYNVIVKTSTGATVKKTGKLIVAR